MKRLARPAGRGARREALTQSTALWLVLRLLAGVDSAAVFVIAVSSLLGHLREHPAHLPGWSFGGVGIGIALTAGIRPGRS